MYGSCTNVVYRSSDMDVIHTPRIMTAEYPSTAGLMKKYRKSITAEDTTVAS